MTHTPKKATVPDQDASRYLDVLSDYLCHARLEDFPAAVTERARWIIADCLPLTAAGMQAREMRDFAQRQLACNPRGEATVIGLGVRADPKTASLLNGTAGTWLEMVEENIYAKGLPAIQVVPAALALAEHHKASGRELMAATVLGYEAGCRISRATKTKMALHPSGTFGVICAAVAAARLARLGEHAMREVINVSATLGLATSRKAIIDGATVGRVYSGASGLLGILAVEMVQAGLTGEVDGVRSVYGSIYADAPEVVSRIPQMAKESFEPELVLAGLGSEFLITEGFIKMHACARSIHPALDLVEDILARRRLDPAEIDRIDFLTYISPTTLHGKTPKTAFGSRFSLPFAVASLIYHGRGALANFEDEAFANPVIRDLALRVNVAEKPEYTALFPFKQPCDVQVRLKDGSMIEARAEYTRGDPKNPRTAAEMTSKFFDVARLVWNREHAQRVFDGMMSLEGIDDVHAFFSRNPI
ncbi:MAG TPA: MmgE/PrpD family protein [Burkholderiales bacterium]|nr:MmgE/PrpD family protein [Burkholderiales bacterium]